MKSLERSSLYSTTICFDHVFCSFCLMAGRFCQTFLWWSVIQHVFKNIFINFPSTLGFLNSLYFWTLFFVKSVSRSSRLFFYFNKPLFFCRYSDFYNFQGLQTSTVQLLALRISVQNGCYISVKLYTLHTCYLEFLPGFLKKIVIFPFIDFGKLF